MNTEINSHDAIIWYLNKIGNELSGRLDKDYRNYLYNVIELDHDLLRAIKRIYKLEQEHEFQERMLEYYRNYNPPKSTIRPNRTIEGVEFYQHGE